MACNEDKLSIHCQLVTLPRRHRLCFRVLTVYKLKTSCALPLAAKDIWHTLFISTACVFSGWPVLLADWHDHFWTIAEMFDSRIFMIFMRPRNLLFYARPGCSPPDLSRLFSRISENFSTVRSSSFKRQDGVLSKAYCALSKQLTCTC